MKLLSYRNAKQAKQSAGILASALHLAPKKTSAAIDTCAGDSWSPACVALCLGKHAGGFAWRNVRDAQKARTIMLARDPARFAALLVAELEKQEAKAKRFGSRAVHRPNCVSAYPWESFPVLRDGERFPNIFAAFPRVQFMDYTGSAKLYQRYLAGKLPPNYWLCFSRKEHHKRALLLGFLRRGGNVALVYRDQEAKPRGKLLGFPCIDGDAHDWRFLDPPSSWIILRAKGNPAKRDKRGFVLDKGEAP